MKVGNKILNNVLYERATSLFNSGRVDEAIETLTRLSKTDSRNPDVYNNLGVFFHSLNNFSKAIESFKKGLSINGDDLRLQCNLADVYISNSQENHAIVVLEQVVSTALNYENAALKLVALYHNQNLDHEIEKVVRLLESKMPASKEKDEVLKTLYPILAEYNKTKSYRNQHDRDSYEDIACPYCNQKEAELYRSAADIVKCTNCDTVYLRHRQKVEVMYQLYQSYADGDSHMVLPASEDEIKKSPLRRNYFLQEILEFTKPEGTLLDVGCGWGAFLYNAREHGFTPRGIEMTKKCVAHANTTLGIKVTNDQFEDTPFDSASIQVITMNHVFEHLPFPLNALKKAHSILVDGGLFCGIVPNISSYVSRSQTNNWYWLDPNYHYVHYSPETLRSHFESNGFKVERMYTVTGDFGKQNVLKEIKKNVAVDDDGAAAMLAQLEQNNLGEEIRFFARKI